MTKENLFYKILSGIHFVFFTSLLCGSTILLSGTLLLLPALGAVFQIGKDFIEKKLNINDSIVRTYFIYLKEALALLKFFPVNLIILLNAIGMYAAMQAGYTVYSVICLVIVSFLLVFVLYITGYYVFINKKVNILEAAFCMFLKPQFLIPVFIVVVVFCAIVSAALLTFLFFTGAFFLFALEVVIFIQMLHFKKLNGTLSEEDEFSYLIFGKRK